MTREEQITYKAGCIADGCIAHGAPWKEYHQGFIEGAKWADANPSQPSLPSNLDEAAHEFEDKAMNDYDDIFVTEDGVERPVLKYNFTDAFKAGAEWMAGQGVSWEDKMTYYDGFLIYGQDERAHTMDGNFNEGDEVVVQIRKK